MIAKPTGVWLGSTRVDLRTASLLGAGGEAEVHALPDGRALKLFKGPTHPDLQLFPEQARAAAGRLAEHQRKLPAFPAGLPERVIVPEQLATTQRGGGSIVGYAMRKVEGAEPLLRWGEPRRIASIGAARVVEVLLDLHASVAALHQRGVVLGDFNDLNVLVAGAAAWLIDADSFSFAGFGCSVFTERFVDPLRCDPSGSSPVLVRPHDRDSDWYAFAVMVMRSLLCVGPYGGVLGHSGSGPAIAHAARPLHRITVFDDRVRYPKPALPLHSLPDSLLDHLRAVFVDDRRGAFPVERLHELAFIRCSSCKLEHARARCPRCTTTLAAPKRITTRGRVSCEQLIAIAGQMLAAGLGDDGRLRVLERDHASHLWLHCEGRGRQLLSRDPQVACASWVRPWAETALIWSGTGLVRLGEPGRVLVDVVDHEPVAACFGERRVWVSGGRVSTDVITAAGVSHKEIGRVAAAGQARIWLGSHFGLCLYRIGALLIPATFDPRRAGLSDGHQLPPIRGRIIHASACLAQTQAWVVLQVQQGARSRNLVYVLDSTGRLLGACEAEAEQPEQAWMSPSSIEGAAAIGSILFVPTDAGLVRVELVGGQPCVTRSFPDTEPFVDAASVLAIGGRGLVVVNREGAFALRLE